MTEKQTFKNPYNVSVMHRTPSGNYNLLVYPDPVSIGEAFASQEWDMEVTFTKKPQQFKPGEKVKSKYMPAYTYTVLAQWKQTVLVVDESDDEIVHFDDYDLVYAVV
jgi:hypothetical protein